MANLYELLERKDPIFVTNHSPGTILLEFRQEGTAKRSFTARVPPVVDHPMRLDAIVPYSILQYDHSVLHSWIQKGALKLHDPKEVENYYAEDKDLQGVVQGVLSKANEEKKFQTKDIGLRVADGAMEEAKRKVGKVDASVTISGGGRDFAADTDSVEISPKVLQIVASLKENPELQQESLGKLRLLDKRVVTEPVLYYVLQECKDFSTITKWAKQALAALQK